MRRKVIRAAIVVVALSTIASVAAIAADGPGLARSASDAPGLDLKPEAKAKVKPAEFSGDLRHIPQGKPAKGENRPEPQIPNESPGAANGDAALQTAAASAPAPAPSGSFEGLNYVNNGAGFPPDTNGDVGPNHYVETVNTSIGIYSKTGTPLVVNTFDALFSAGGTGTPCDNSNQGDPVVLYDPIGDRWIISDFAWADANFSTGPFYQCFAVSKTARSGERRLVLLRLPDSRPARCSPTTRSSASGRTGSTCRRTTSPRPARSRSRTAQVWAFDRVAMESGQPARRRELQPSAHDRRRLGLLAAPEQRAHRDRAAAGGVAELLRVDLRLLQHPRLEVPRRLDEHRPTRPSRGRPTPRAGRSTSARRRCPRSRATRSTRSPTG